jgi:hypothetical protein
MSGYSQSREPGFSNLVMPTPTTKVRLAIGLASYYRILFGHTITRGPPGGRGRSR